MGQLSLLTIIPVMENSEVVVICPDIYIYTLWQFNITTQTHNFVSVIYKWAIVNSHVKLPEGVYLSIRPSVYPSIHLSIYLFIYLSIYPSIHISIYLYTHTYIYNIYIYI